MNAFTLFTLSMSLIAFSSLQADDPLEATLPLDEDVVAVLTPTFSIEEEIDQPLVINFKTLQVPLAEEEDVDMYMPNSENELLPQTLETPVILPLETQEIVFQPKADTHLLVQTSASPPPVAPAPRIESSTSSTEINMREVFQGAPLIYSLLLAISVGTFALWFYTLLNMRTEKLMPHAVITAMQENLHLRKTREALDICRVNPSLLSSMLHSGLLAYQASPREMMQNMQSEGKRVSCSLWQKLGLLNDVAIVAPMIGLLGTVVGMFYAFYDINRSVESMNALFDGLGISVGTTVAGLILAILALGLHSTSKYRLVKQLTKVERAAHDLISELGIDREKEEQKEQTP